MTRDLGHVYDALLLSPTIRDDARSQSNLRVYRPRHLAMARFLTDRSESGRGVIADIGCHNGFFLRLAMEIGFRACIAVDAFPLAPERSFLADVENVRCLQRNFNEDGFLHGIEDLSVDVVSSTEVLEHLYHHPLAYLLECWRILKPGGLLLLTTPNPCTVANAWRLARGRPISWGGVAFATTPRQTADGAPIAVWDIHFREYAPPELQEIVTALPDAAILAQGFLATAADPASSTLKRVAKAVQWGLGFGHWRPVSATQYLVLQRSQ